MSNRYYGAGLRVAQTHAIPSPPPLHPTNPPPPPLKVRKKRNSWE